MGMSVGPRGRGWDEEGACWGVVLSPSRSPPVIFTLIIPNIITTTAPSSSKTVIEWWWADAKAGDRQRTTPPERGCGACGCPHGACRKHIVMEARFGGCGHEGGKGGGREWFRLASWRGNLVAFLIRCLVRLGSVRLRPAQSHPLVSS